MKMWRQFTKTNNYLTSLLSILILCFSLPVQSTEFVLKPGRYAGFVYLKHTGFKIPATLDTLFIPRGNDQAPKLAAFLKLSFGGFRSHEYLTHTFFIKDYDWSSHEMVLDAVATGLTHDITLDAEINTNGTEIHGLLTSIRGDVRDAEARLLYLSPGNLNEGPKEGTQFENEEVAKLYPNIPIYPALTGSYENNTCGSTHRIQMELTKGSGISARSPISFDGYTLSGRVIGGIPGSEFKNDILTTLSSPNKVQYDFYNARIAFSSADLGACVRTANSIDCGQCSFTALPEKIPGSKNATDCGTSILPLPKPQEASKTGQTQPDTLSSKLKGKRYTGSIHFEERNTQHPFTIDINVAGKPQAGDLTVGARTIVLTPKIYIELSSDPSKSERFIPINLDPVDLNHGTYPLVATSSVGDMLQITQWTENEVLGVFYSGVFGRVGTFRVFRDGLVPLDLNLELPVSGTYLGKPESLVKNDWGQSQINFRWMVAPPGSGLPYFLGGSYTLLWNVPLALDFKNVLSGAEIESSRFDPFTGFFGAEFGEPDHQQNLFGKIEKGKFYLSTQSNVGLTTTKRRAHEFEIYSREEKYRQPDLPRLAELRPGVLHIYLPFDSALRVNGIDAKQGAGRLHRVFQFPKNIPQDKVISYDFAVTLPTGRVLSKRVSLKLKDVLGKPYLLNFYELQ